MRLGHAILVLLFGVVLYVPNFWRPALQREEARRAIPAREMVASGDYVVPTIWQRPYLRKPPLHFWTIAAAARLTGGVDEVSTRLPSILSTIVTALLVYAFAAHTLRPRDALCSALLFLVTFACLETATYGEIDPYLLLWTFAASAAVWLAPSRGLGMTLLAGLALGGGVLTKGPPALVFFGIAAVSAVFAARGQERVWRSVWRSGLVPLVIGLALGASWVVALLNRPGTEDATRIWARQTALWDGENHYLRDLAVQAQSVATAFLPGLFVVLCLWSTRVRRVLWREPVVRFLAYSAFAAFVFFVALPGSRPRYAYPAVPWWSLLAGTLLSRSLDAVAEDVSSAANVGRRLALCCAPFLAVGALVLPLAVYGHFRPLPQLELVGPAGIGLAAATTFAAGVGVHALLRGQSARMLVAVFALLAGARLLQLTEIVPAGADRGGQRQFASELAAALPAPDSGARLRIDLAGRYNELFHVGRPFTWIDDLSELRPGDCLVTGDAAHARAKLPDGLELRELTGGGWGALLEVRSR